MDRNFIAEINKIDNDAETFIVDFMEKKGVQEFDVTTPIELSYNDDFGVKTEFVMQVVIGVHSDNDICFVVGDDHTIVHTDELICGEISKLALIIKDEIEGFYQRMEEQEKLIKDGEVKYEKRFFFLPDKFNPTDLDDMEFASLAFKYGKVISMDNYAKAFNSYQLDDIHSDKGVLRVIEYSDTIVEYCPHCECEVLLPSEFKYHECPVCRRKIAPCNLCKDCTNDCPLLAR